MNTKEGITTKTFDLTLTESEMRDHLNGLELLHGKCVDLVQAVKPFDPQGNELKKYFVEKQSALSKQILSTRTTLLNSKL